MVGMFHQKMLKDLKASGRRSPQYTLQYWRRCNEEKVDVSPGPFDKVAKAFFLSQASSASAERLGSDLERLQGRQRQSLLNSSLEMNETICTFVASYIKDICDVQTAL